MSDIQCNDVISENELLPRPSAPVRFPDSTDEDDLLLAVSAFPEESLSRHTGNQFVVSALLRSPGGDNYKYLLSESEPASINIRLCQAPAEISEAATDNSAFLQTYLAGGEPGECERESRQTEVASTQTEFSRQQEYSPHSSEQSVHVQTNIAASDCQQWKTWSPKYKFLATAFGENKNYPKPAPAETLQEGQNPNRAETSPALSAEQTSVSVSANTVSPSSHHHQTTNTTT